MWVKKKQLEPCMEHLFGSVLRKVYGRAVYCHTVYLTYVLSILRNAGMDDSQAGIKTAGRNINNFRCVNDTTLMAKVKRNQRAS